MRVFTHCGWEINDGEAIIEWKTKILNNSMLLQNSKTVKSLNKFNFDLKLRVSRNANKFREELGVCFFRENLLILFIERES